MLLCDGNDVSALVLTVGESTTPRAIASIDRQTMPPAATIIHEGAGKCHEKFNAGVASISTRFFVQVDADMVLDRDCIEILRNGMADAVGAVYGRLRDPMEGRIVGIKLFRTECFKTIGFRDCISPDSDFVNHMANVGWSKVFALRFTDGVPATWHTVADHLPDYTIDYTYNKYLVMGMRDRYWKRIRSVKNRLRRLHMVGHPYAIVAQIALVRGIFIEECRDVMGRRFECPVRAMLEDEGEVGFAGNVTDDRRCRLYAGDTLPAVFKRFFRRGAKMAKSGAPAMFRSYFTGLGKQPHKLAWIAQIGLCRGFFSRNVPDVRIAADIAMIRENYSQGSKIA